MATEGRGTYWMSAHAESLLSVVMCMRTLKGETKKTDNMPTVNTEDERAEPSTAQHHGIAVRVRCGRGGELWTG